MIKKLLLYIWFYINKISELVLFTRNDRKSLRVTKQHSSFINFTILYTTAFMLILTNIAFAEEIDANKFVEQYGKEVQSLIRSNLNYKGDENAVTAVNYTINPDGSVTDIKLEQASGTNFDKAVIEAVQKSAPFKPFPKELNISNITMTSGFQHIVQKSLSARMSIMPIEPPAQAQEAYKKYMDNVNKYIFDRIPTIYSHIPQEPVISCTILKDGTITNFKILQSSGIEEYDKKIIETYSKMRLEPFPEELNIYEELPYSVRIYSQIRRTPSLGVPGYYFR